MIKTNENLLGEDIKKGNCIDNEDNLSFSSDDEYFVNENCINFGDNVNS